MAQWASFPPRAIPRALLQESPLSAWRSTPFRSSCHRQAIPGRGSHGPVELVRHGRVRRLKRRHGGGGPLAELGLAVGASRADEGCEEGVVVLQQVVGRVVLSDGTAVHDGDAVVVDDGVEAVGDGEDGARVELRADGRLDQVVGGEVDGGGGLVHEDEARALEQHAREAEQLHLARREVGALLAHLCVEAALELRHHAAEVDQPQRVEQLRVGVLAVHVEVGAQRAGEEPRVLRDDAERRAQLAAADGARGRRHVEAVDLDDALVERRHPQHRQQQRRLARARAADDAHALAVLH
mmetsp:Transcript_9688/g.24848  ORF Transcript_9688/g.24848 Transcript_9688/m.24848 type:complete len:296 (-) Transcript_9688:710-1597(-)